MYGLPTIVCVSLATVFAAIGVVQLAGPRFLRTAYERWDYSPYLRIVTGVLDFVSGPVATMITSFDVWASNLPRVEIYGSEGSLSLPDPNTFGGPVRVKSAKDKEWQEMPLINGRVEEGRGLGVRDMASAIREDRLHRANTERPQSCRTREEPCER